MCRGCSLARWKSDANSQKTGTIGARLAEARDNAIDSEIKSDTPMGRCPAPAYPARTRLLFVDEYAEFYERAALYWRPRVSGQFDLIALYVQDAGGQGCCGGGGCNPGARARGLTSGRGSKGA